MQQAHDSLPDVRPPALIGCWGQQAHTNLCVFVCVHVFVFECVCVSECVCV
jgi:hypothetical protein